MYVMADTARESNGVPSPAAGRANFSPGQRTRQNPSRSGAGGRGGRREADDNSAPRRNDVGTYGWGSEEVKRQGRVGRRGEHRGQGRRGSGPGAAQRRDNSADRFIPGGGLPQWSDPLPRPERIGAHYKEARESLWTRAEPVVRESESAPGLYREGGATGADLSQNGVARESASSQFQVDDRNNVTKMRWGDSPSPVRGESRRPVGDCGSPSGGSSFSGTKWLGEVRNPGGEARNSGLRYDEWGGRRRGGVKAPMVQTNAKPSGLDGRLPVQTISSSLTNKDVGGQQRRVPGAQSAGRGTSLYIQENRHAPLVHGGVIAGHSGTDFHAPRGGNFERPGQQDRMGHGKVGETSGLQSGWVQVGSSRGSGAAGRSQTFGIRGDRQDDYRQVESSKNFNTGHSRKASWGTDSLSEDDINSITSEESTFRNGSRPMVGSAGLRRVAVGTVLRTNQNRQARIESSQEGGQRSRRERQQQPRENFRKDQDSVTADISSLQTSPAIPYVRDSHSVTKQASPSSHDALRRINDPGGTVRLKNNSLITETVKTDRTHQSATQTADAVTQDHRAVYRDRRDNRANWRSTREQVDNRLDETYNRQDSQDVRLHRQPRVGVAASLLGTNHNTRDEPGLQQRIVRARDDVLPDLHVAEAVVHSQTRYGGNRGGPVNIRSEFPAKELGSSHGSAVYKPRAVDMVGGDGEILPNIVGTCPDMCPARERDRRERLRDLSVLERVNGQLGKTSRDVAVKKFCRTISSLELKQSDVRPLPVLRMTIDYLWTFLDRKDISFKTVHDFLFDRTRAVRQDIGMQQIVSRQAIGICEEIVRFHIISERELHQQSLSDKYLNSDLNQQQLSKSLFTLLNMYAAYDFEDGELPYEAEFHAYFVLLNLGKVEQAEDLSLWFSLVQQPLLVSTELRFARNVLRCFRMGNFQKYFQLVKQATYLQACLLELSFNQVRAHALDVLNRSSYKLHPYPIADLVELLLIEEEDVKSLCTLYGLPVGVENSSQAECLLVKLAQFSVPEKPSPWYHCRQVEAKRPSSHLVAVLGTT